MDKIKFDFKCLCHFLRLCLLPPVRDASYLLHGKEMSGGRGFPIQINP